MCFNTTLTSCGNKSNNSYSSCSPASTTATTNHMKLYGIHLSPKFDEWRIVPYAKTLLFNFKTIESSEDEAIAAIAQCYGTDTIMSARKLDSDLVKSKEEWLVIEVSFKTDDARAKALESGGMCYKNELILPITTCTATDSKYIAVSMSGLCLFPSREIIQARVPEFIHDILVKAGSSLTKKDIKSLTIEEDDLGLYRGRATVILQGSDQNLVNCFRNPVAYYFVSAPNYPNTKVQMQKCYLYCDNCVSVNDHATIDCKCVLEGRAKHATSVATAAAAAAAEGEHSKENASNKSTDSQAGDWEPVHIQMFEKQTEEDD
ncbi:hypothetical protein BDB00DRAFT_928871 [Zychaea mexicana]|uniref:uncharacterized protein n=1 Tax=Zychaea mexicana TaxID=64656 RepID=UPI0022FF0381|nr:uncharacterized protein BDB00DRAFT_928871 [Zychaea mexicana]KAI9493545.1 hypothetical protein BDB00DRAFT_928871 [Zychaea mexicana]